MIPFFSNCLLSILCWITYILTIFDEHSEARKLSEKVFRAMPHRVQSGKHNMTQNFTNKPSTKLLFRLNAWLMVLNLTIGIVLQPQTTGLNVTPTQHRRLHDTPPHFGTCADSVRLCARFDMNSASPCSINVLLPNIHTYSNLGKLMALVVNWEGNNNMWVISFKEQCSISSKCLTSFLTVVSHSAREMTARALDRSCTAAAW